MTAWTCRLLVVLDVSIVTTYLLSANQANREEDFFTSVQERMVCFCNNKKLPWRANQLYWLILCTWVGYCFHMSWQRWARLCG